MIQPGIYWIFKQRIGNFSAEKSRGSAEGITFSAFHTNVIHCHSHLHGAEKGTQSLNQAKVIFFNLQEKPTTITSYSYQNTSWSPNQSPMDLLFVSPYFSSVLLNSSSGSTEKWKTACTEIIFSFQRENQDSTENFFFYFAT